MNLFKWLFSKSSRTGYSIYMRNTHAEFTRNDYVAYSKEAYQKNIIAYQAINKKAKAVAQIPWVLKTKSGADVTGGPIFDALESPNHKQSLKELLEQTVGYYCLSGNIYWEKTSVGANTAPEFYALRPDCMKIRLNEMGEYDYFKFESGAQKVYWEGDDVELIRHIKTFNPLDDVYGLSPIESAAYSIDQHNEASVWMQSLLQNGAAPSGAFVVKDELSEEAFQRLKQEMEEKQQGSKNAGRPLLLEGGADWKAIGMSPQNMSILETKFSSARDIALAFEVPPLLLSIQGDSTYNNYKEARLAFYEESVIPLAEQLADEFANWNEDRLRGAKVHLDVDCIPAIVEKRQIYWDMANSSTELTINERRELKGYEPIEGGDELYIDSNKIPLSFDDELGVEPKPDPAVYGEDDDQSAAGV